MTPANRTFSLDEAPEVFFTDSGISAAVRRLVASGDARALAARLYTRNVGDDLAEIARRNVWQIAGGYFPEAVVADRTAIEGRPTDNGSVFLAGPRSDYRTVELPGLALRIRPGSSALPGDTPFIAGLHLSSEARAMLDNLRPSRGRSGPRRTLGRAAIEERLAEIAAKRGDDALNDIRDQARALAGPLDADRELHQLDGLIGGLVGTKPAQLETAAGRARRAGRPQDPSRLELFDLLFAEVKAHVPERREERPAHAGAVFAFYEAYFSNFIEGTEFLVEEAKEIVFEGKIPSSRPKDAHDILGSFQLVNDHALRRRVPGDVDDYLALLRDDHARLLGERAEARPGRFKEEVNQAGGVVFVDPGLVEGTLAAGFERYRALEPGFQRAVFQTFLVAEVHPFDDGNGRLARVMTNAELSAAGQQRLMITTAGRDDYVRALRALSYNKNPGPLVGVLDVAQDFAAGGDWSDDDAATATLTAAGAFDDPRDSGSVLEALLEERRPGR